MSPEERWERIRSGLQHAREARGLSKRSLARKAGVVHSTINRIESGESIPDVLTFLRVARALGIRNVSVDGLP